MGDLIVKSGQAELYRTSLGPGMDEFEVEEEDRTIENAEGTTTKVVDRVIQLSPGSGPTGEMASATGGAVLMFGEGDDAVGINAGNVRAPSKEAKEGGQGSPGSEVVEAEDEANPETTEEGEEEETKEELMIRAQELEIEGRSYMNKEELAAAVADAEKK